MRKSAHFDGISVQKSEIPFYLRELRETLLQSQLFLVNQTLIKSHMRYGNLIWGRLPENLSLLKKIQNRVFYFNESAPLKDQIPPKRLNVEKIVTYDRAIMVHKILKKKCPEDLMGKFTRRTQISKYETRRINDLQVPKPRLN